MARKIRLVHSHEIKPGESATIDHDGREFVVFNIAGRFYTLPNLCPHIGGPLAGGGRECSCGHLSVAWLAIRHHHGAVSHARSRRGKLSHGD